MPPKRTRTSRLKVAAIARTVHHAASSQHLDGVDAQQTISNEAQPSISEQAQSPTVEGVHPPISEDAHQPLSEDANPPSQATQSAGTSSTQRSQAGRDIYRDWVVDVIDENGIVTTEKMKAKQLWNLPSGKRVICPLNSYGQGIGQAGGMIGFWLGDLATDTELIPLNFFDWRVVPERYMRAAMSIIESNIAFENSDGLAWAWQSLGAKRKDYRSRLFKRFGENNSRETIMANCPGNISQDQWNSFVDYRLSERCNDLSTQNKENRNKLKFPHTGGSKSNARRKHDMELEKGRSISRGELFIATRKRKDGTYISEEARTIAEQVLEKLQEFEASQINDIVISTDDAVGQVLGKEHSGRVRGLGLVACPSKVFGLPIHRLHHLNLSSTSSASSSEDSLKLELNAMKEKLECMQRERELEQAERACEQAERAREQVERAREQAERARIDQMMKYLVQQLGIQIPPDLAHPIEAPSSQPPDMGSAEASLPTCRRSSEASHDP